MQFLGLETSTEHRSKRRKMGKTLDEVKEELVRRYNTRGSEQQLWFDTFDKIVNEQEKHFPLFEVFLVSRDFCVVTVQVLGCPILFARGLRKSSSIGPNCICSRKWD